MNDTTGEAFFATGVFLFGGLWGALAGMALAPDKQTPLSAPEPRPAVISKVSVGGEDILLYKVDEIEVDGFRYLVVFSANGSVAITKK